MAIDMIAYKARIEGIKVHITEESYTSKCSFFDGEYPEKRASYAGKRVKRGLFRTASGFEFNADINGSLNIILKIFPDAFSFATDINVEPNKVSPF